MPLMYAAAGEARNATALAASDDSATRPDGLSWSISFLTASVVALVFDALFSIMDDKRPVAVAPGKTLFTVMPNCPTSLASVFAQLATAARMVLLTPRLGNGCFTDVEMILMIL